MTTIPQRLARRARQRPGDVAIEQLRERERLTFRAWEERSNAVARGLAARRVRCGERVVVHGEAADWVELAIAYIAVQKAGGVPLPASTAAGADHLAWAVGEAGAVGVIGRDTSAAPGVWCASTGELAADRSCEPLPLQEDPDSAAEILYTSGTTGRAKGVVASHANMLAAHDRPPRSDAAPRRVLHCLQPATMAGQGLLVLPLHPEPHTVLTLPQADPRALLAAVAAERPTDLVLVPAIAVALTRVEDPPAGLDSVELVRSTSAPIAPATLARLDEMFPRARVINLYATTESWPARTQLRYDRARAGSVGRPGGGAAVRVTGRDGRPLPAGEHGDVQLQVRGTATRSYFNDPAATRQVFLDDGWVRTGDVGYLDAEGYLYLVDRNADLINVGGRNVSALDLQAVLEEQPGVRGAAVLGVTHPTLGETVVAAIEATDEVSLPSLDAAIARRLGAHGAPRRIVLVDELPRNVVGKLLKRELRERLLAGFARDGADTTPMTPTEERVMEIWRRALGVETVRRADNFFDAGGTSLAVLDITAQVRDAFGVEIEARRLLQAATLADYARAVADAPPAPAAAGDRGPTRIRRSFEEP